MAQAPAFEAEAWTDETGHVRSQRIEVECTLLFHFR